MMVDFEPRELPPYDGSLARPPPYECHPAGQHGFDEPCEWLLAAAQNVRQEMRRKSRDAGEDATAQSATAEGNPGQPPKKS